MRALPRAHLVSSRGFLLHVVGEIPGCGGNGCEVGRIAGREARPNAIAVAVGWWVVFNAFIWTYLTILTMLTIWDSLPDASPGTP